MAEQPLPSILARMDGPRLRAYRESLDFYNGIQWLGRPRRRERWLTFNYVKAFVDKVTSYLMTTLSYEVEPLGEEGARRAREALQEVYEANRLDLLDFDTELDTSILGDGCFKVFWDEEEGRVRVSAPDVQGVFAWWRGDDISRIWRVASRYRLSAEEVAALYGFEGRPQRQEYTVVETWTAEEFQLWIESALWERKPNPYGFIPFVIFPNIREPKKFWGVSDIPSIIEPARELNRAFSQLSMILELSGNPIAVLENVEETQDIAVQPGAVWALPEKARAYLLDLLQGGGVQLHTDYINHLYRALHDLSETPRTSFGENLKGLSGVALEMELQPLLQKVRRKRLIRTAAYKARAEMVLRLLRQKQGMDFGRVRVRVIWGPVLPQDLSAMVADQRALVEGGLSSRRRAMASLGIEDPEAELAHLREEQKLSGKEE